MIRYPSLFKRVLLALVPGVVIAIPLVIAYLSDNPPNPHIEIVAATIYCALIGGFVMVPFITSRSRIVLRACFFIVMAPLVYFLISRFVSMTESLTHDWSIGEPAILFVVFAAVFAFNLLNAILLAIVAPLKTNREFWGLVGLIGAVTGVLFALLFHYFFCIMWCDWTELLMGIPLFVWPILFCTSIYAWKTQSGDDTAGGHQNLTERQH
jgi:hypothetical protein